MKCYTALTERAEDFQLKITFTKYHKDIAGRSRWRWDKWQQCLTVNLSALPWQTRLIRVRTPNNVFLKPGSVLYKVSGAKSLCVLCGELRTWRCWLCLHCHKYQAKVNACKFWWGKRRGKDVNGTVGWIEWRTHSLNFYKKTYLALRTDNHSVGVLVLHSCSGILVGGISRGHEYIGLVFEVLGLAPRAMHMIGRPVLLLPFILR